MGFIHTINLPDIGEGVIEGEVIQWLKKKGDPVLQDEPVVVVMTDKATVELPSPYPGVIEALFYQEGDIALVGKPLYSIQREEKIPGLQQKTPAVQGSSIQPKNQQKKPDLISGELGVKAIPSVRKMAHDWNIPLEEVQGTGKEGRITREDLQLFLKNKTKERAVEPLSTLGDDLEEKVTGIHRLMAEKMATSKRVAPHFSYFEQLDATRLIKLKENMQKRAEKEGIHITYMPFIIRALSMTLKEFPRINSTYAMDLGILYIHKHHNIGIAIHTPLGLIVPVLFDVQEMNLEAIIRSYDSLIKRAKDNALDKKEMKGSTITISNFGSFEGTGIFATPVINYPEVAILALARIQKLPQVKGDKVVIRDTLNLSWSFDHRVIDGYLAASFSHHFSSLILNPSQLLL